MLNKCYKCESEMKEVDTFVTIKNNRIKAHAFKCTKCGEEEFSGREVDRIQKVTESLGIWGHGLKLKRKLQKIGKSTAVYIPSDIQKYLHLKPREEITIGVEGRKIVIEPIKRK